jgi:hypothetical protein
MDIKDLMKEILSAKDAKQGLHVDTIAQRLLVAGDECTREQYIFSFIEDILKLYS